MESSPPLPFRFQPLSNSWVALHPNPKGIIQFIGGAFFGTWPTFFYRYLLRYFYEQEYTIIALPFQFSFRHWRIAATLANEQKNLQPILTQESKRRGYDSQIYAEPRNYLWLGHSMGCKYIALLECLSTPDWENLLYQALDSEMASKVIQQLKQFDPRQPIQIIDQASVLLAPDISDTDSAIPLKFLARLLDKFNLGVSPTRSQTQQIIQMSNLFNLTGLISFDQDKIAGNLTQKSQLTETNDVLWILGILRRHSQTPLAQELPGKHLEPMGITWRDFTYNPFGRMRTRLNRRSIEALSQKYFDQM